MNEEEYLTKIKLMAKIVQPFIAPIFLIPTPSSGPNDIITNGTITFVDTGKQKLYITCKHVWDEYITLHNKSPEVTIAIGLGNASKPIIFNDAILIDDSTDYDIATLEFPNTEYIIDSKKQFISVPSWPPVRAEVNEFTFVAGFPGLHRVPHKDHTACTFHETLFGDDVSSSSERHFVLADTQHQRRQVSFRTGLPEFGRLGGLSGAPAFANRNKKAELCGFMYEGGDGTEAIVFIAHASHIGSDGHIIRGGLI